MSLREQQERAAAQGRRAGRQGDSEVAGHCPHQQGYSPVVPE